MKRKKRYSKYRKNVDHHKDKQTLKTKLFLKNIFLININFTTKMRVVKLIFKTLTIVLKEVLRMTI